MYLACFTHSSKILDAVPLEVPDKPESTAGFRIRFEDKIQNFNFTWNGAVVWIFD